MDFSLCYQDTVSRLSVAARQGHRLQVKRFLQEGSSPHSGDNRGWKPLHEAAAAGRNQVVLELLKHGGPGYVDCVTHEGQTACYLAAEQGHLQVVRFLLKAGADPNLQTNDLCSPLYAAVNSGHLKVAELLLQKGANTDRNHSASRWTCLHQAACKGFVEIVRILIHASNLEAKDEHTLTPLFVAAHHGREEVLKLLLDAGADANAQACDLATPLFIAAQEGHAACVDLLLSKGADPNLICSTHWVQLPIHAAVQFGHFSIVQKLLEVTDRQCDQHSCWVSPVYVAVENEQTRILDLLLKEGFNPNGQESAEQMGMGSPLTWALLIGKSDMIKMLLDAGASICEENWHQFLATEKADLLEVFVTCRRIPGAKRSGSLQCGAMSQQELDGMLRLAACQHQARYAVHWLPVLLKAGLDPVLLLQEEFLRNAKMEALNKLLEFVNWSTLAPPLKQVLGRRLVEDTRFGSLPSLLHLCRLRIREVIGADKLMTTEAVQQLPVPALLHDFLTFKDVL